MIVKKALEVILSGILALVFLPISIIPGQNNGMYNTVTRLYWCKTDSACLHEYAHWLDQEELWVSETEAFQEAFLAWTSEASNYANAVELDELGLRASLLVGKPWKEVYAEVYVLAGGNLPANMRPFYPQLHPAEYKIVTPFGEIGWRH